MEKKLTLINQSETEEQYQATFAEKTGQTKEGKAVVKTAVTYSCILSEKPEFKTGKDYSIKIIYDIPDELEIVGKK